MLATFVNSSCYQHLLMNFTSHFCEHSFTNICQQIFEEQLLLTILAGMQLVHCSIMALIKYFILTTKFSVLLRRDDFLSNASVSSSPSEQLQPLSALFSCKYSSLQFWSTVPRVWLSKALYLGSVKRWHWYSAEKDPPDLGSLKYKYYFLHLSKEPVPKNVSDLEVAKTYCFSPMYPDFNVWKKVGNSYSTVSFCIQQ